MRYRPDGASRSSARQDSVIKILISTDNHLGYLEKDPVRGDDSFRVFEEVLELARANSVDMLLLAGDLFHDNKPSRATVVKTMRLLRRMCMSPDGAVRLAVRSDPAQVNYMDPCVAVSLPVFVIHGNHDDPTGAAGLDALSALDLLSEANLITYFGKMNTSKKIDVSPVLLQKGLTSLALYGLGNVRDEVLYDTWAKQRKVKWLSPEANPGAQSNHHGDADGDDMKWFNLFVLHQNRLTRGSSKGISDTLLPPWLDYVVWGHEHDSIPDLTLSKPPIVQPGSTVATSLTVGESKQKHAILLEIYCGKLKHRPIPLRTVRNFEFADVALSAQTELSETNPEAINAFLARTIDDMVNRQEVVFDKTLSTFQNGTSKEEVNGVRYPPREFYLRKLTRLVRQPLIRLRVEITGNWEAPNPQRFGQGYVGRVACAAEVLLFYRSKRRLMKRTRPFLQGNGAEMNDEGGEMYGEEDEEGDITLSQATGGEQDVFHIPKLVQYYLYHRKAGGTGLKFLELDKLTSAVDQFVNKLEPRAIPDYVTEYLKVQQEKTLNDAAKGGTTLDESQLLEKFKTEANLAATRILEEPGEKQDAVKDKTTENANDDQDEIMKQEAKPEEEEESKENDPLSLMARLDDVHAVLSKNPKIAAATAATKAAQDSVDNDSDDEGIESNGTKGKPTARGRGRGRGRKTPGVTIRKTIGSASRSAAKPPPRASSGRRASRKAEEIVVPDSDEDDVVAVQTPKEEIVIDDSEEEYVPVSTTRKRRPRASASSSRAPSRARTESTPSAQQPRRSLFASRARLRRNTATIDLDEESGDDAM